MSREHASINAHRPIILVTDAWHPQVNGVVTTIDHLLKQLARRGVETRVISPAGFPRRAFPWYPEIDIARPDQRAIASAFDEFEPDARPSVRACHIVVEYI